MVTTRDITPVVAKSVLDAYMLLHEAYHQSMMSNYALALELCDQALDIQVDHWGLGNETAQTRYLMHKIYLLAGNIEKSGIQLQLARQQARDWKLAGLLNNTEMP